MLTRIFLALVILLSILISLSYGEEDQRLLKFASFDFTDKMYPKLTTKAEGAAIISKNFIKLIPAVPERTGRVSFRRKVKTPSFEADLSFKMISGDNGFALWYFNDNIFVSNRTGDLFGSKRDFSGLGIFITTDNRGRWIIHAEINRGMKDFVLNPEKFSSLDSCTILGNVLNTTRTIRYVYTCIIMNVGLAKIEMQ